LIRGIEPALRIIPLAALSRFSSLTRPSAL
jgi:hypothetical protein